MVRRNTSTLLSASFTASSFDPPLPFAEDSIDVLYSISIFTHLRPEDQARWATDIRRVLRPGGTALLTFCVLVLRNGFTVTGESACASPENFDAEIGRKIARANAVNKLWPLMGYALKERLAAEA